jgi:hypothetical protein
MGNFHVTNWVTARNRNDNGPTQWSRTAHTITSDEKKEVDQKTVIAFGDGDPYIRQIITINAEEGTKVIDVKRVGDRWTGDITVRPRFLRWFGESVTHINYETLQYQMETVENKQEALNVLRNAPSWMDEDVTECAISYFSVNRPDQFELNQLKGILSPEQYKTFVMTQFEKGVLGYLNNPNHIEAGQIV